MKLIICLFVMLISAKECDQKKAQMGTHEASSELTLQASEMRLQDHEITSYRASTRGFYLQIWIEGDSIKYTNDYNLKAITTRLIPKEEKEAFIQLLSAIDETALSDYEAPSKTHHHDAAPAAFLEISKGGEIYRSKSFDHGKPPKAILDIVEKILYIKDIVEKQ
ncbi:hypothetical protein [Psychroserpens sp. SPM9]|uniref:hypothetical protein n=1 Tax=Psychroserpens sp. SPM9 TaxID=2975598 RepID=UPI0021A65C34|nr:hypothetical protein [Psychroserpens sp. SPM9]MDG5490921.1 hypothetical protein [Psychroserpens sp. SPM9]